MNKEELTSLFTRLTFLDLGTHLLFSNLELWCVETEETKQYHSVDEILEDEILKEKLDNVVLDFFFGGRGARNKGDRMGFDSAKGGVDKSYSANPAQFNDGGRYHNTEHVIQKFISKFGSADREYAVTIDEQGFAHSYRIGNKHSVSTRSINQKHTIVHNHPGGGNFSKADLMNTASSINAKGIVATNKEKAYRFEKTSKFDAKGFTKALSKASWSKKLGYDKGADLWLKKNAKKYGYVYEYK